jgi:hypothetical protein
VCQSDPSRLDNVTVNMCSKVALDIRQTIANATAYSDERATASIGPFTVECAQAASKESGCFARRKKRLGWNVHSGLVCQCQTKSGGTRQFMAWSIFAKCSNQPRFSLWIVNAIVRIRHG